MRAIETSTHVAIAVSTYTFDNSTTVRISVADCVAVVSCGSYRGPP